MVVDIFIYSLWQLTLAMAPYILFGLLVAAILHETIPQSFMTKHLSSRNTSSLMKASLFGIPRYKSNSTHDSQRRYFTFITNKRFYTLDIYHFYLIKGYTDKRLNSKSCCR
jgi:hypothetical protein